MASQAVAVNAADCSPMNSEVHTFMYVVAGAVDVLLLLLLPGQAMSSMFINMLLMVNCSQTS